MISLPHDGPLRWDGIVGEMGGLCAFIAELVGRSTPRIKI